MDIAVTGAAGFLGRNLTSWLRSQPRAPRAGLRPGRRLAGTGRRPRPGGFCLPPGRRQPARTRPGVCRRQRRADRADLRPPAALRAPSAPAALVVDPGRPRQPLWAQQGGGRIRRAQPMPGRAAPLFASTGSPTSSASGAAPTTTRWSPPSATTSPATCRSPSRTPAAA